TAQRVDEMVWVPLRPWSQARAQDRDRGPGPQAADRAVALAGIRHMARGRRGGGLGAEGGVRGRLVAVTYMCHRWYSEGGPEARKAAIPTDCRRVEAGD